MLVYLCPIDLARYRARQVMATLSRHPHPQEGALPTRVVNDPAVTSACILGAHGIKNHLHCLKTEVDIHIVITWSHQNRHWCGIRHWCGRHPLEGAGGRDNVAHQASAAVRVRWARVWGRFDAIVKSINVLTLEFALRWCDSVV